MYMHTYGKNTDPVVVLLHPMGITAEKVYEIVGSKLNGDYYLLIPDMGNHGQKPVSGWCSDCKARICDVQAVCARAA